MKKVLLSLAVVLLGSTFALSTMAAFFPDNIEKMCLAVPINDQKAVTQCNQAKIGFMKQFVAEKYAEALAATKNKKKLEASQKQFEKSLAAMLKGRPYRTADDAVQDGLSLLIERAIDLQAATLPPYPYPKETLKYCKGAKGMDIRGCYYQMNSDVTKDMDKLLQHALSIVSKPADLEDQQDMWKAEMDDLCAFTETQGNSGIERELMCQIVWTQIRIAELKKLVEGAPRNITHFQSFEIDSADAYPDKIAKACKASRIKVGEEMTYDEAKYKEIEKYSKVCYEGQEAYLKELVEKAYQRALENTSDKSELESAQSEWLSNLAKHKPLSLTLEYRDRLMELMGMALPQESYPEPFSNCSQSYGLKCDRLQLNYDRKAMRSALAKALEKSTDKNALLKAQRKFKASILAFCPGEIVPEKNIYCEDIWTRTRTAELNQLISEEGGTSQTTKPTNIP